jgi:Flp pilus assembly pilin Flp
MVLKNQKGQTMVEYMMLIAVVISLIVTFFNSDIFKRLFGQEGMVGQRIKEETEFAYRHAYIRNHPPGPQPPQYNPAVHPSYHEPGKDTRFFGPRSTYPNE